MGNLLDNPVLSKEWLLAGRVYIVCCTNQAKSAVLDVNTSMQQLAFWQVLAIFSVIFECLLASFAVNIEGKMCTEFDL